MREQKYLCSNFIILGINLPTRHIWPLTLFIKEVVPTLLRRYLESRANYDNLNGGRTYLSYLVRYLLDSTLDRTANLS